MRVEDVVDQESLEAYLEGLPKAEGVDTAGYVDFCCTFWRMPEIIRDFYLLKERNPDSIQFSGIQQFISHMTRPAGKTTIEGEDIQVVALAFLTGLHQLSNDNSVRSSTRQEIAVIVENIAWKTRNRGPHLWHSIQVELDRYRNDVRAIMLPSEIPNFTKRNLAELRSALLSHSDKWGIWVRWLERLYAGRDVHTDILTPKLEALTSIDLGLPSKEFNLLFDDLDEIYKAEDVNRLVTETPIAADVVYEDDTFQLRHKDQVDESQLKVILNQIADATCIFDGAAFGTNSFPLNREVEILKGALTRYHDRPVELLKTVTRVCKRLDIKVKNGECPSAEKDADIADFREILVDVQIDLIAFNPEVKAYHDAKKQEVDEQAAPKIAQAAREVSASADSAFATALTEAAFTLLDPTVDDFARQAAQYWIIGAVTRSYKAIKTVLDEAADVTTKTAKVCAGILYLLSPQFRLIIDDLIRVVAS